jgi:anti-sigma factor ChrR (cupin superfamily)
MIPEQIETLALADAAGALDTAEQAALRRLVASLPVDAQSEVARLYDLTEVLGSAVDGPPPSPQVRDRLMASILGPSRYTQTAADAEWLESGIPGLTLRILALDRERDVVTMLLRGEPGARYPSHRHTKPEECYVLRGSVIIDGRVLGPGDFHHADADSDHGEIYTVDGAEVLLVAGAADYLPQ